MGWIAIRMLTGDRVKFIGLLFGIGFSTLLITQQLTIFVNLLFRGGTAVEAVSTANVWVMDPVSRTPDLASPMPDTALDRVRGVPGVAWAVPLIRANAVVKTAEGDLEGVSVIGVDDATLIGLPRTMIHGSPDALADPDAVFVDGVGSDRLFEPGANPVGTRLELNDQRAIVRGVVDVNPTFTSTVVLYTRYSNALKFVPGTRNRLTFVIARAADGVTPEELTTAHRHPDRPEGAHVVRVLPRRGGLYHREHGHPHQLRHHGGVGLRGRRGDRGPDVLALHSRQHQAVRRAQGHRRHQRQDPGHGGDPGRAGRPGRLRHRPVRWRCCSSSVGTSSGGGAFKGFYIPWQIPVITAVVVVVMILLTGWLALRSVLKTEPAEVFR